MKFFIAFTILMVVHVSQCGLLRTPRVYNALVTSGENLAPSRAFPVIQPVLHEAAYGYPLHPLPPYGHFQPPYSHYPPQFDHPYFGPIDVKGPEPGKDEKKSEPESPPKEEDEDEKEESLKSEPAEDESPEKSEEATQKPESDEAKEPADKKVDNEEGKGNINADRYDYHSFLPTHDFGLPPSVIPLSNYNYDHFSPYSYSNLPLVYPYNLNQNHYPVLAPEFYNYPNNLGHFGSHNFEPDFGHHGFPAAPSGLEKPAKQDKDSAKSSKEKEASKIPQMPLSNGDNKNIMDKNPEIPDVPPPPAPTGGEKE